MPNLILTSETPIGELPEAELQTLAKNPNDYRAQRTIGAILRQQLVEYLRTGTGSVATAFRSDDKWADIPNTTREQQREEFLTNMSKSGFYSESFALPALAEMYDLRFEIKQSNQEPYIIASEQTDKDAPLHQINHEPSRFDIPDASVYHDGTCLFYCVAIAIARTVYPLLVLPHLTMDKTVLSSWQTSILTPITEAKSLEKKQEEQKDHSVFKAHIDKLIFDVNPESKEILNQIEKDEELAYRLAQEEWQSAPKSQDTQFAPKSPDTLKQIKADEEYARGLEERERQTPRLG